MQKKFETDILLPELELKKQRLSEIRELHQPLKNKEILSHAKKHDKIL
jgi:hypothetical protein